jgi:predicted transcriptional regulator
MGFTRIVERFNELYSIQSALSIIIDKYGYSLEDISKKTGISYNTLYSLKSRRRDISKINVETALKLSTFLHIRMETICEIKI